MSGGALAPPPDGVFVVGPAKIVPDERDPPPLDDMVAWIEAARRQGRATAVHCVTAAELALALAAFEAAGPGRGDRIEHGGVVGPDAIPVLRRLRVTVVTQPGFVLERGDRYLAEVDPADQDDLYRCASLLAAGVPVAASSDAPYSTPDPWLAMRAARDRLTAAGRPLGAGEAVSPRAALDLFLGAFDDPGGPPRRIAPGEAADLCLLKAPLAEALDVLTPDLVWATVVAGRLAFG
jgi:predicted amidohydrolase YtcJ